MVPKLFDSHTHVQFPEFDKDRDQVIKRAHDADVWIINAGSDKENSAKAVEIANKYKEGVYAVVGQHPSEAGGFDFGFFRDLAQNPKVIGIGECGLDYYRSKEIDVKSKQETIFVKHMELANEVKKPLVIHCREAFPDLINILITNNQLLIIERPGILHFFTGTAIDAKQLLDMGFYFTFGGLITYNRSFDEVIKSIPLDRILLETDAPYVSPEPYRGNRNEPAYIVEIAKKMAELKGVSFEEICDQTTENAKKVFAI